MVVRFKAGRFEQWECAECKSHDRAVTPQGRPSNFCREHEAGMLTAIRKWKSKKDALWMIRPKGDAT